MDCWALLFRWQRRTGVHESGGPYVCTGEWTADRHEVLPGSAVVEASHSDF